MASHQETQNASYSMITSDEAIGDTMTEEQPKSSQASLIFAMMAAALGTGIFNLPLRITEIGLLTFVIYVALSAFFSYHGAILIMKLYKKFSFSSYGEMSESAYGVGMKRASEIFLILFPWGIAVCFQVILVKFLIQLGADVCGFNFYSNRDDQTYNTTGNLTRILLNVGVIVTQFFFIVKKQLGIVQKLTRVGIVIVSYNTLTIFALMLFGFTRNVDPILTYHGLFHLDWSKVAWVTYSGWESFSQHVQALSSILFCYVNHQLVFFTLKNIQNPTTDRLVKTFQVVNIGESIIYLLIGISGYLLLIEHEDVEPIGAMVIASITAIPMTIGKFLMVFSLYICVPLNMFPARQIFYEGFNVSRTSKNRIILSVALAFSSCLIAIAFQHVNSYFGLLGGTAGVMMAGGIPALCYLKLVLLKDTNKKELPENENTEEGEEKEEISMPWEITRLAIFTLVVIMAVSGAILSIADPS